jgi:3-hydroxybutyrate dehydrogenase
MPYQIDLSGRAALVTGGASGIGRAIAEELTAHGACVLIADLNETQGQSVADGLARGKFQRADVTSREDCYALVDRAEREWGGVDILVNCAGIQHVAPVEEFPEDRWDLMMRIMLTAPFLLTRRAIPSMYAKGWGRIINLSSIHGLIASPYKSAYTAAKHGLVGFTKSIALEAGDKGVTVNAICPSYVRTPLVEGQINDLATANHMSPEDVVEQIMLAPAARKQLLAPADVAALALYLCSEMAAGITGSTQTIDCGWTAR